MKRVVVLHIIVFILFSLRIEAQSITPMELKNARLAVYDWLDDYIVSLSMRGRDAQDNFLKLFESENVQVVNDYFVQNNYDFSNTSISASEYASLLAQKETFFEYKYEVKKVELISEKYEDGNFLYEISFEKNISFTEKSNGKDSRYEYPVRKANCIISLSYNLRQQRMVATQIKLRNNIEPFVILHSEEKPYNECYKNVNELNAKEESLNNDGLPIITQSFKQTSFDSKIYEKTSDTIKNAIWLNCVIGNGFLGKMRNTLESNLTINSKLNFDVQVGWYRQLRLNGNKRTSVELGVAYNYTKASIENLYNDSYYEVDADGGTYQRQILVPDYNEFIRRNSIGMPIALRADYFRKNKSNNNYTFFGEIGFMPQYCISQQQNATANALYRGYYDWLFNVTIDQNGIYDFGNYDISGQSEESTIEKFSLYAIASVGMCYYVTKRLALEGAVYYQGSIYNSVQSDNDYHLTKDSSDWKTATYSLEKYFLQTINFKIQLNYNF